MDLFLVGFGGQVGAEILKKSMLDLWKNYLNNLHFLEPQKIKFGTILASKMGPREGLQKLVLEIIFGLGRVLGQDGPKTQQR